MADFLPHFQEVENVTVLLDGFERLLEDSRLKLRELEQISSVIGSNLPGYISGLERLHRELFSQIDYFLDTTEKMLELFEIANCLDAAGFYPDYHPPNVIGYVMFQLVYLYGLVIVHDRVGGHLLRLTALDEELNYFRTRVQAQLQNEGY